MDITEYIKQQGQFLKAEHVNQSPTKVFIPTKLGELVQNEKYDTQRLHVVGEMDGAEYVFDMSKTNARAVAEKLGNDTIKWVGKKLKLETYRTKTSDGKMVEAVNIAGTQ